NIKKLPDLRGLFLRGINKDRTDGREDPEGEREAGSYQEDELQTHNHRIGNTWADTDTKGYRYYMGHGAFDNFLTHSTGGKKTRPKNAAVFWYIKVN
ncbi:MAG: hypothetical protein JSV50_03520, partial [Desulfobacteraceae bacterium]